MDPPNSRSVGSFWRLTVSQTFIISLHWAYECLEILYLSLPSSVNDNHFHLTAQWACSYRWGQGSVCTALYSFLFFAHGCAWTCRHIGAASVWWVPVQNLLKLVILDPALFCPEETISFWLDLKICVFFQAMPSFLSSFMHSVAQSYSSFPCVRNAVKFPAFTLSKRYIFLFLMAYLR